ncbi:MAG: hypothetical protein M9887_02655 [Chitinophagales bacterium]|nr:hypothetical protein [Chitinophagales bacterium]
MKKNIVLLFALILLVTFSCKKEKTDIQDPIENPTDPEEPTDTTSIDDGLPRYAWMSRLLKENPNIDIKFSDICLPGAHDAGMYVLRSCKLGNACNTQTQELNMKQQLEAGYRIFDLRPTLAGQKYFAYHYNECGGVGCRGDLMENIFNYTNEFLEKNNEVVIFLFDHFCQTSPDDIGFLNLLNSTLGDKIYKESAYEEYFYDWSLRKILGDHPKTGKVILIFKEGYPNTPDRRKNGYFSEEIMQSVGGWSNKNIYQELKQDQLRQYNQYQPAHPKTFLFSYQQTLDDTQSIACALNVKPSIKDLALETNPDFQVVIDSMIQVGAINAQKHPNIFWLDFGESWMIDVATKISEIGIGK